MDYDCNCKRGRFIENSTAIREKFKFADPTQVLQAVQVHCCDLYGGMLWNLYGEKAEKLFRCWDAPRSTHTYFVDCLLAVNFKPLRQQALTRYVGFYSSLLSSPCKEVAVVSRIVGRNANTTTGRNLLNLQLETGLNASRNSVKKYKDHFQAIVESVPEIDVWRIPLLTNTVKTRLHQQLDIKSLGQPPGPQHLDHL